MTGEQIQLPIDARSDYQRWIDEYRRDFAKQAKGTGLESARVGDPDGHDLAIRTIRRLVTEHGSVTADDVQAETPIRTNAIGSAFAALSRAGELVVTGFTTAKAPQAHGRLVRIWGLA